MITKQISPLVKTLDLAPHPEGGWYKELWKASFKIPKEVLGGKYSGSRYAATSIYFLLHPDECSAWHTVLSDELWLFHSGTPLKISLGGTDEYPETTQEIVLGLDIDNGQLPQVLVPANVWQKTTPLGDEPTLVSCVVAPGFNYDDFKLIDRT